MPPPSGSATAGCPTRPRTPTRSTAARAPWSSEGSPWGSGRPPPPPPRGVPVPGPGGGDLLRGQGGQPSPPGTGLLLRRRPPPGRPDAAGAGGHRATGVHHRVGGRGGRVAPTPGPQPTPQPTLPDP